MQGSFREDKKIKKGQSDEAVDAVQRDDALLSKLNMAGAERVVMDGPFLRPADLPKPKPKARVYQLPQFPSTIWKRRSQILNLIAVPLPVIAGAIYLWGFAADSYQVDTIFSIRNPTPAMAGSAAMSLGSSTSTTAERAIDESYAVVNFIRSRAAFDELERNVNISFRFQSGSADFLGGLSKNATYEQRYKYYRDHVQVYYDDIQGQITLTTYAYDADTVIIIAKGLAEISEKLVNEFNNRARTDMITLAEEQVQTAAAEMRSTNDSITNFQLQNGTIDPSLDVASLSGIITQLRGEAASEQAKRNSLGDDAIKNGPRATESINLIKALKSQIEAEQGNLTGKTNALAPLINRYKLLSVDQQLAQQKYSAAVSMLQNARLQAEHQKLYIVNVVNPERPPQPVLPDRPMRMFEIILLSILGWWIQRMVFASIRDHRI